MLEFAIPEAFILLIACPAAALNNGLLVSTKDATLFSTTSDLGPLITTSDIKGSSCSMPTGVGSKVLQS